MVPLQSNRAYDVDAGTLTAEYRSAVEAAIPDGICVTAAFWRELTKIVVSFSKPQQNRASRPPAEQIKRWERVKKLATELGELGAHDPAQSLAKADAQIAGHRALNEGFDGKRNLHNETLYGWVLDLWRRGLGQPSRISRDKAGAINGPTVRFFAACTAPLLERPLTPRGISEIIERKNKKSGVPFSRPENIL